jgi:hypothetical protein
MRVLTLTLIRGFAFTLIRIDILIFVTRVKVIERIKYFKAFEKPK